ncbi:MAG: substrate-binding domain-containing protein [Deltaproteobacteria bacterium]|nr:substrate-binding domain-containing protein [Deltaproteobacteria bacterium]
MLRKRILSMAVVAVLVVGVAWAAVASEALPEFTTFGEYKKQPPYKIGFAFHGGGISWDIQAVAAFKYIAKNSYGYLIDRLYVTEAQFQVSKQIADIEDLMAKGIDGLVISTVSPTALIPTLDRLYDKGFPVAVVLTQYDGKKYAALRMTDGTEFGRVGAEWLVEQLVKKYGKPKGNLLSLRGVPGAGADVARWDRGAKPVFDKYPEIKIVGMGAGKWAYDEGRRVAASLLAANPNVDGIWSCGGQMSLAAAEVLLEKGLPLIPITGEDYNGFFKFWIKHKPEGFSSVSPTFPSWIATRGLAALMDVLQGETVLRTIWYAPPTITDETVERFVMPDLPDTIWVSTSLPRKVLHEMYGGKKQ